MKSDHFPVIRLPKDRTQTRSDVLPLSLASEVEGNLERA